MPLYSCIQNHVNFDITEYQNFMHYDIILDEYDIINNYINSYNEIDIDILHNNL